MRSSALAALAALAMLISSRAGRWTVSSLRVRRYLFHVRSRFPFGCFSCQVPISKAASPKDLFPLFVDHWRAKLEMERERERDGRRLTAGAAEEVCRQAHQSNSKTAVRGGGGGWGQPLIMARPQLDVLWKVTVDESSIIYSITEQGYLFFQQHEQQGIMAQNKQPVAGHPCDCQKMVRRLRWWRRQPVVSCVAQWGGFTLTVADSASFSSHHFPFM